MSRGLIIPNAMFFSEVEERLAEGKSVIIPVKGYSMDPFIRNGRDSVELVPAKSFEVGDIVLAHLANGDYVLHRVVSIKEEVVLLMGDGNIKGTECALKSRVVGVVTRIIQGERSVDCTSSSYLRKVKIWGKLLPARRYILAVYRRLFY